MSYTKVDYTDGNTPVSEGNLDHMEDGIQQNSQDIDDIDSDGDGKVDSADSADILVGIEIIQGAINHGETLPLPSGYSESECHWIVSLNELERVGRKTICRVDNNRVVRIKQVDEDDTSYIYEEGIANYLVIGIKS